MPRFSPLDHPSDVGITAFGRDQKEIFENAAFGLFSLMADLARVRPEKSLEIKVTGDDLEGLLVNWLNELIYLEDGKKLLFCEFKINKLCPTRLDAVVRGEKIDPARHRLYRSVKAATFNQLHIGAGEARIVFDV